jgi:membrane protease YdiL (CAAX protease family)
MDNSQHKLKNFFPSACLFEALLIPVAVVLGWIADINPVGKLHFSETAILFGVIGTLPLILMFWGMQQLQQNSIVKIRDLLLKILGEQLHSSHWTDLLMLAILAGFSEELLFRGVLQPWMTNSWGATAGLIASNLLFGLAHAVTPLYAVLAALVGCYLGWSLNFGNDSNLLTPIIIHSLYDFLAFLALMRSYRSLIAKNPGFEDL